MDLQAKLARCRLVVSAVAADDVITAEEQEFLRRALDTMGLDEGQLTAALHVMDTEAATQLAATLADEDKDALLQELVDAAWADGVLHPSEQDYITRVAEALGRPQPPGPSTG